MNGALNWREDWPNFSFEKLVAMYINDCLQYLTHSPLTEERFEPTENQELVYYGLRQLKDACMEAVGEEPMNWQDAVPEGG